MKKIITLLLAITLIFTIVSCNNGNDNSSNTPTPTKNVWASWADSNSKPSEEVIEATSVPNDERFILADLGYDELTEQEIQNLYVLGKVWGFLKYYHPNIRAGNFDWDMELIDIIEPYAAVKSEKERDQLLLTWIEGLGVYEDEVDEEEVPKGEIALEPDYSWIDSLSDEALKQELNNIIDIKRGREHHYVDYKDTGGYLSKNEEEYADQSPNNLSTRILTLFRYWNIYYYYSPNIDITDVPWDDVLKEMIPGFISEASEDDYHFNLLKLLAFTGDGHSSLNGKYSDRSTVWGESTLPIKVRFFDDDLVVIASYSSNYSLDNMGLQPGDVITYIDGITVEEHYENLVPYSPLSYEAHNRILLCDYYLLMTDNSVYNLTIRRDGNVMAIEVPTKKYSEIAWAYSFHTKSSSNARTVFKDLGDNIVYINFDTFSKDDLNEYSDQIMASDAMIWDLRSYPDYYMFLDLFDLLLPEPLHGVVVTEIYPPIPGTFVDNNSFIVGSNNPNPYTGQIIALVDEYTASSPEFLSMHIKAMPNAIVMGRSTAGADGNVSRMKLPCGLETRFSGLGIFYPDGTQTQRIGIIPDIIIEVTAEAMITGRDEIFNAAVEYIKDNNE